MPLFASTAFANTELGKPRHLGTNQTIDGLTASVSTFDVTVCHNGRANVTKVDGEESKTHEYTSKPLGFWRKETAVFDAHGTLVSHTAYDKPCFSNKSTTSIKRPVAMFKGQAPIGDVTTKASKSKVAKKDTKMHFVPENIDVVYDFAKISSGHRPFRACGTYSVLSEDGKTWQPIYTATTKPCLGFFVRVMDADGQCVAKVKQASLFNHKMRLDTSVGVDLLAVIALVSAMGRDLSGGHAAGGIAGAGAA